MVNIVHNRSLLIQLTVYSFNYQLTEINRLIYFSGNFQLPLTDILMFCLMTIWLYITIINMQLVLLPTMYSCRIHQTNGFQRDKFTIFHWRLIG